MNSVSAFESFLFGRIVPVEQIVRIIRLHPFELIESITPWVFFGIFLPIFLYKYNSFGIHVLLTPMSMNMLLIAIYIVVLYNICLWYFRVWIVTTNGMVDLRYSGISFDESYIDPQSIVSVSSTTSTFYDPILLRGDIRLHTTDSNLDPILRWAIFPDDGALAIRSIMRGNQGEARVHTLNDTTDTSSMSDQEAFSLLLRTLTDVVKEKVVPAGHQPIEYSVGDDKPRHKYFVETAALRIDTVDLREDSWDKDHQDNAHHGSDPPVHSHHTHG